VSSVTTQIAVRLPEELVEFIDRLVADGQASSRAAVVSRALQRERRREIAARDAAILAAAGNGDEDLDALAEHAARIPLDDLD
jgi:Arc/MetJ-type ribon-helix-helix transcriptional regulator